MKKKVKACIAVGVAGFILVNGVPKIVLKKGYEYSFRKNSLAYEQQINEYDNYVKEYAQYINSLGLSDLEIIMKVMKDSWDTINGYGKAEDLVVGFYRLSFQEEGKGVCTSFADDFTAKMNAINPKYKAENVYVYMDNSENAPVQRVNIERTMLPDSSETQEETSKEKKYGNHLVSMIRIPEHKICLIVDPTNLMLGIMKNGKIYMFNTMNKDMMEYKINSNFIFSEEFFSNNVNEYLQTFNKPVISDEEIENAYGYESQNAAFEKIDDLELPMTLKRLL